MGGGGVEVVVDAEEVTVAARDHVRHVPVHLVALRPRREAPHRQGPWAEPPLQPRPAPRRLPHRLPRRSLHQLRQPRPAACAKRVAAAAAAAAELRGPAAAGGSEPHGSWRARNEGVEGVCGVGNGR